MDSEPWLAKYFFSQLNGQVFILSTNEEIDSRHIKIMKDKILVTYMLENSDNNIELGKKTPGLTVLIRIAEALEVATDWILRAETPGTYAVANEKIGELLEDCSNNEMQDFLRILEDVKRAVRRNK